MPLSVTSTAVSGQIAINMAMAAGEAVAQPVLFSPLDLTGCEVKMQVEFPSPLVLSTGNGGITIVSADEAGSTIRINIASTTSEGLKAGSYPYEFWVVGAGGLASRLWVGTFAVTASFTAIP